ncbi:MAG: hypothetical protein K2W97_05840 [Chthoniobacterales bacterium]|nr:hypothetical protein [Chthoniobacterales bacterium]
MKPSFLALPLFLLSFFGITSLELRAESVSEQTVTRENYREYLQSVSSQEDSSEFYGANVMAEGIIQTTAVDGTLYYIIEEGIDLEDPIHGLTKLQQEHYCRWIQDQKPNKGTSCYLKNEAEENAIPDNQETVIVISSSEKGPSPLMMFKEPKKKEVESNATQQERINGDRTSEATDLSSLQQRGTQPAEIKEPDDASVMSDLTHFDDASTRVSSYHQSPIQLEKQITAARQQAFAATQELLALQSQQHEIEALWDSYRNIQKTLASAYTLQRCLKKSNTDQLQSYQQIVHGICREAELAYNNAQQKLKIFRQLPGYTPAANTFIEEAYAKFSETQKKLYNLKQQHEQGLSADADSLSSTLVQVYQNSKHPSEITPPSPSKISKPTAEEQEALRLEQFLKEHQWYGVGKGGKKIVLPASLSQEEHEVQLPFEEKAPQKLLSSTSPPAPSQKASRADSTTTLTDHQPVEKQDHQEHIEVPPAENLNHSDEEIKITAITPVPSKKKPQKKKKASSKAAPTSQTPAKSDADWEEEVKKKFPLHSFDLEQHDYHQFQENAARKVKSLIEDPSYLYLFQDIGETAREGMRNLAKHNYGINGTESTALLVLKKFIKQRVNEEYYPSYLAQQIRSAKFRTEEKERLSRLAAEAEKKLLAELETETQTRQSASATKKSKSKKK